MLPDPSLLCGAPPPQRGTAPAPVPAVAPSHLLVLPSLHREVPPLYQIQHGGGDVSPIALAMLEEGILTEEDFAGTLMQSFGGEKQTLLTVASAALDRWVRSLSPGILFDLRVVFTDSWQSHFTELIDNHGIPKDLAPTQGAFTLSLTSSCAQCGIIGPRCERLEELQPGLGAAVVDALEEAFWDTIGTFGPSFAHGFMQSHHWMGESDYWMAFEDMYDNITCEEGPWNYTQIDFGNETALGDILIVVEWKAGPKEIPHCEEFYFDPPPSFEVSSLWIDAFDHSEYIISEIDFFEELPKWSCDFRKKGMTPQQFRKSAARLKDAAMRSLVRSVADMDEVRRAHPPAGDYKHFYAINDSLVPMILGWKDMGDPVSRFYDDHARYICEGGEGTAIRNIWTFDAHNIKSIRRALNGLRNAFTVLQAIERTLPLVCSTLYRDT